MNLKIPLDQGLCGVFTDARSGERTPTGAVRRGLRPSPHRSRGESGFGARTVFTATSDRAVGLLREAGGNDESATVTGNRGGRRVRPGLRPPSGDVGNGDLPERSEVTGQPAAGERCGETTGHARRLRASGDLPPSGGGRHVAFGRCVGNGVVVEEPKELGPPQLDSARSVPMAPGPRARATGSA